DYRLSYLLISHNLAIVERLCDEVVVLYLGRIVETGPTPRVLGGPAHPYTAALLSAVPRLDADKHQRATLDRSAQLPTLDQLRNSCPFHPRCPIAIDRCRTEAPPLQPAKYGGSVACHRADELTTN